MLVSLKIIIKKFIKKTPIFNLKYFFSSLELVKSKDVSKIKIGIYKGIINLLYNSLKILSKLFILQFNAYPFVLTLLKNLILILNILLTHESIT